VNKEFGNETCPICLSALAGDTCVVALSACVGEHYFHRECIVHCYKNKFLQCPICSTVYGIRVGTQPEGTMVVKRSGEVLEGHSDCGTIQITYKFPNGKQGEGHPTPGKPYTGTTRTAYLPDNKEGNEVLKLLEVAWKRKLIFRVGTSVTTGADDQVVWNSIHHKTSTNGGPTNFGFPDDTYFDRVKAELADKGVTIDDIK